MPLPFSTVTASRFLKRLGGSSEPCVFACASSTDSGSFEVVTKLRATVKGRETGLLFEWVAARLAAALGIPMPTPLLVEIPEDLPATLASAGARAAKEIADSVGLNFGTLYVSGGYSTIVRGMNLPRSALRTAADILAFDAVIDNADRRIENPNILWRDAELLAIDHELAFAFVRLLGGGDDSEMVDIAMVRNHPFFAALRGQSLDLTAFVRRLDSISDEALSAMEKEAPPSFGVAHLDRICRRVSLMRSRSSLLGDALSASLR